MLHRVLSAAALAAVLGSLPGPGLLRHTLAGDEPVLPTPRRALARGDGGATGGATGGDADGTGARWPAALQKRNARYASLTRVGDPEGDLHERLISHLQMVRIDDRLGDLEELRRKRAAGHVPPRHVLHARVARDHDLSGDEGEVVLASITNERRHAETRRFRDLGGDYEVLVRYRIDVQRAPAEDRIYHAADREDVVRRGFFDRRDDMLSTDGSEPLRERERQDEFTTEQQEERQIYGGDYEGRFDDLDEKRAERDLEKVDEKKAEREEKKAERDLDDLEEATAKSQEQLEERMLERQTEVQNEREESGAGAR